MACNAVGIMVSILYISLYFVSFWHPFCMASPSYHHSNAENLYEQRVLSKNNKAGKHHAPPSARIMPPPPPTARPKSPTALPKAPSIRPGQAPLSVVESEAAFTLYYGRNFKVVQNLFNNFTYLLLQQVGDSNGKDWDLNISVFEDPLTNFTMDTSSAVGYLELLGSVSKLRGVPASFGLASPCILQLMSQGEIPTIELDSNLVDPNAVSSNISFEALFGSSTKYTNVQFIGNEQNQSNYISFDPSMERGPLQRAEWIKFLASFFNMEERANIVFGQIRSNYQCLNASSKGGNTSKPVVAWLSYNTDLGVWTFSDDPYKLQLNLDAGGSNLDPSTLSMTFNMSIQSNVDNFYNIASVCIAACTCACIQRKMHIKCSD
eukprot:c25259_g3_i1 orf=483-1613(-)